MIFGDFNAHHFSWSSISSNQRGTALSDFLSRHDLVLTNDSSPTRINVAINAVNRFSLLDLTIASTDIAIKCHTEVSEHLLGSDHYLVFTHYSEPVTRNDPRPPSWSFRRAHWEEFSRLVDENIPELSLVEADIMLEEFTKTLISSARSTIPRTKHHAKAPAPWWTAECNKAVRRKRAALKKMKRTFRYFDIINYKKMRSACR